MQEGSTALILAASNGHSSCVSLLVENGADMEVREDVRVWERYSSLHSDIYKSSCQDPFTALCNCICRFCLNSILSRCTLAFAQNGATAMMWAAHNGRIECVRQLLKAGANRNARDQVPFTCESCHVSSLNFVLISVSTVW